MGSRLGTPGRWIPVRILPEAIKNGQPLRRSGVLPDLLFVCFHARFYQRGFYPLDAVVDVCPDITFP